MKPSATIRPHVGTQLVNSLYLVRFRRAEAFGGTVLHGHRGLSARRGAGVTARIRAGSEGNSRTRDIFAHTDVADSHIVRRLSRFTHRFGTAVALQKSRADSKGHLLSPARALLLPDRRAGGPATTETLVAAGPVG